MAQFITHTTTAASPEQVLHVLTDPEAIRDWSPVPFEVEDLEGRRLAAGSRARLRKRRGAASGLRRAGAHRRS